MTVFPNYGVNKISQRNPQQGKASMRCDNPLNHAKQNSTIFRHPQCGYGCRIQIFLSSGTDIFYLLAFADYTQKGSQA